MVDPREARLILNDSDRTLIKPEVVVARLDEVAATEGLFARNALLSVVETNKGNSFDVFGYMQREMGITDEDLLHLEGLIKSSMAPEEIFYDDTRAYLEKLSSVQDQGVYSLIYTYGPKPWQRFKLSIGGLDQYPHIITSNPNKAEEALGWRDESGVFVPPGYPELAAAILIGVDDKDTGLIGLGRAYQVDHEGTKPPRSDGIPVVRGLLKVLNYEGIE